MEMSTGILCKLALGDEEEVIDSYQLLYGLLDSPENYNH